MGKTRKGLKYEVRDEFYKKAKEKGFVARSAFKLEEIDRKQNLYKAGMRILDLGCAPGSWLQYASRRVGSSGRLFGIDLDEVRVNLPNVETVQGDIFELRADDPRIASYLPFDFIQSDAMTKTVGVSDSDCARSVALAEYALHLADKGVLKTGGSYLCKVFEGPGFTEFYTTLKRRFRRCSVNRPESIRPGSREVYVLALDFRGPVET
jgi:23S rRNA (uridine2552-2'-O)-methyltransferase